MVSREGSAANQPRWSGDGKAIIYVTPTLQLMSVSVDTTKSFQFEAPRRLFNVPLLTGFTMTADGKRLLMPLPEGSNAQSPFTVVTNWQAVLQK